MIKNNSIVLILFILISNFSYAQNFISNENKPEKYIIGGINISGIKYLDPTTLVSISGLKEGSEITIPGDEVTKAIKKYWTQGLFSDVKITADSITSDNKIFITIHLEERPRISKVIFEGIKKSEQKDLDEKLELKSGSQVTDNVLNKVKYTITNFFVEKGRLNTTVTFERKNDPDVPNRVILKVIIDKGARIKINDVVFIGNKNFPEKRLERALKETRERKFRYLLKSSKYIQEKFNEDKANFIKFYNKRGYRDIQIIKDSLSKFNEERVNLYITISEGNKYYFGDISWIGNTKYSSEILTKSLGIKKGDIYDQELLDKRLFNDEDAVSSLYLDNGYLFSNIDPIEVTIESDTINYEMRIFEGKQARINEIIIEGNSKTNEHVIRREIRTLPGDLFSKRDIIRSVRELAQLGHFDPEKLEPNPIPNQSDGTVDIKYSLTEKANDQLELSGGWGAGMLIGTLGVRFNNFAAKDFFKSKAWRPIPSGDGQSLSLRAQTNGRYYQSYSMSFVEPWFGGKKPNSLSFSLHHTIIDQGYNFYERKKSEDVHQMKISGASLGLGRRLKWPDDYFTLYNEMSYQRYMLSGWSSSFLFTDGISNSVSFSTTFGRNSVDQPIYPRGGSNFSLSLQLTPPFSLFNSKDYTYLSPQEKYKWIEYNKWKFNSGWYTSIVGNLVFSTKAEFGYLAYYNKEIGPSPFESFDLGGDGLTGGFTYYERDIVALRGYKNGSLTPIVNGTKAGNIYDKFTLELRYPFVLKTAATVYGLIFAEGGNAWYSFKTFNPYDMHRSAGLGIRAFLPMFGMLGVDWGYGFDAVYGQPDANKGNFHFVIGQQF